jgi:hypothetical protein
MDLWLHSGASGEAKRTHPSAETGTRDMGRRHESSGLGEGGSLGQWEREAPKVLRGWRGQWTANHSQCMKAEAATTIHHPHSFQIAKTTTWPQHHTSPEQPHAVWRRNRGSIATCVAEEEFHSRLCGAKTQRVSPLLKSEEPIFIPTTSASPFLILRRQQEVQR